MLLKLHLTFITIIIASSAFSQTDADNNTDTKMVKVNNEIYMLQGKGGNIGLSFGDDGIFMIDDQYADGILQIQKEISNVSDKPVQFLLNTHFHGDHTGGNLAMAETGTVILSQENVRARLLETIEAEKKRISEKSLPIITFSDDLNFYFNSEKIYIFHVHNAHTDGDAMVFFTESNVLHTGDVFFNGKYPYIDTQNGGSLTGSILAIEKALMIINDDTKIIPGHGDVGTFQDLLKTKEMLEITYKKVAEQYLLKKTESEVIAMNDLTNQYDEKGYGDGFIKRDAFIKMLYAEFKKERSTSKKSKEKNK